jgi:hypothetical protein
MTRRPTNDDHSQDAPLYAWLLRREEDALWCPSRTLPWTPEQPSYTGRDERLAALRAGEPVDVPVSALPRWARAGEDLKRWWRRATVSPHGAVTFWDDDGSAWLQENEL